MLTYLGNGIYAEFDGSTLTLKTGTPSKPSNEISLTQSNWEVLKQFIKNVTGGE